MIPWGWAGVVKTKRSMSAKLNDRGTVMMMVGYADNHTGDCYRMYNDATRRVHISRDVRWLDRMFFSKEGNVNLESDDTEENASNNDVDSVSEDEIDENKAISGNSQQGSQQQGNQSRGNRTQEGSIASGSPRTRSQTSQRRTRS